MRIMYVGLDKRVRITKATRVRFLEDGFQSTDRGDGIVEGTSGPLIVVHLVRAKGGKRLILSVPERFNMRTQELQLLQEGWADFSECTVIAENLY